MSARRVVSAPFVLSGAARIAGTRIAVKTIVSLFLSGMSGDEVAFWCAVTIEDVDAALRYALRRGKKR